MIAFWKQHGTKVLGGITALLATLLTLTPDQMHALFGVVAPRVAIAVSGLLTVIRGFTNTAALSEPAPVIIVPTDPPTVIVPPKQSGNARVGLLVAVTALAGCASLGLTTPKGFDQQLANAYGVHTAVVSATATALSAGSISEADAVAIQGMEQNARALLDAAHAAEAAGNTAGASSNLALATTALTALQAYINSHGSK